MPCAAKSSRASASAAWIAVVPVLWTPMWSNTESFANSGTSGSIRACDISGSLVAFAAGPAVSIQGVPSAAPSPSRASLRAARIAASASGTVVSASRRPSAMYSARSQNR